MPKTLSLLLLLALVVTACGPGAAQAVDEPTAAPTQAAAQTPTLPPTATDIPTVTPTDTPSPTSTPNYPPEGYGPSGFPPNINPLTGLEVDNPSLLERRPLVIKVENLPRSHRPQFGLSAADIVYEYYTEEGSTRMAAIFLGQDAAIVGPIRSARFFDDHLIRMFKAVFAFGSADYRVRSRLYGADYNNRLVIEAAKCPPMCRYEPNGSNFLVADTAALSELMNARKVPNGRQDLDGMTFQLRVPEGGQNGFVANTRYSAAIYERWDYDVTTGKYFRFADAAEDYARGANEQYIPALDRTTGLQISADNVVILLVPHSYFSQVPEMVEINLVGSGPAYIFRDGLVYQVLWQRANRDAMLTLTYPDGKFFPFKPGKTWFQVMGTSSQVIPIDNGFRFVFGIP
ncbi:MAG: DUF3048 domain-containing protein [Anaerolineales bacterium]